MRTPRRSERRSTVLGVIDGFFFVVAGGLSVWLAYAVLRHDVAPGGPLALLIVFWLLLGYLVLPRLHRILTRIYVPGYFIGRTRTSDGLLGDPVNLAFRGRAGQVHQSMVSTGWTRADDVDLRSSARIVTSTLRRRSYAEAPVSPLHLFDRQQDFAYQREVDGSPSRRHHIRFWRCPDDWLLPGGFAVDWLAAATFDSGVGLSFFTLQMTHRIEANTDVERDFVVESLSDVPQSHVEIIKNFSSGYHSRNGGGDRIQTDGDLPIVDLTSAAAPTTDDPVIQGGDGRPVQSLLGAAMVTAQAGFYLVVAVLLVSRQMEVTDVFDGRLRSSDTPSIAILGTVLAIAAIIYLGLAAAVLLGRNWARLLLLAACTVIAVGVFAATTDQNPTNTSVVGLPTTAASILVLLALSSNRAREFASRRDDLEHDQ